MFDIFICNIKEQSQIMLLIKSIFASVTALYQYTKLNIQMLSKIFIYKKLAIHQRTNLHGSYSNLTYVKSPIFICYIKYQSQIMILVKSIFGSVTALMLISYRFSPLLTCALKTMQGPPAFIREKQQ